MLQQTQVDRVVPKYRLFLKRFPTLRSLARARCAEVLRTWIGLGYNGRAVRLWRCARAVVSDYSGRLPTTPQTLASLPGIGPYTAAAVAAIAFDAHVPAVDVNVRRVLSRALAGRDHLPSARVRTLAEASLPASSASQWTQALMDIGAQFCKSRPRCERCPLVAACAFHKAGKALSPRPSARTSSTFIGSRRFYRGWVIRMLGAQTSLSVQMLQREVKQRFGISDRAWLNEVLRSLARDGLVSIRQGRVRLP